MPRRRQKAQDKNLAKKRQAEIRRRIGDQLAAEDLLDEALEQMLFAANPTAGSREGEREMPDWSAVHVELRRKKGVTLQLLWQEDRQTVTDPTSNVPVHHLPVTERREPAAGVGLNVDLNL